MGIVRPVMDHFTYAWIFFVPFILVTTFTVLNLFIGIIVDAMASVKEEENAKKYQDKREQTVDNIEQIKRDMEDIKLTLARLEQASKNSDPEY